MSYFVFIFKKPIVSKKANLPFIIFPMIVESGKSRIFLAFFFLLTSGLKSDP